MRGSIRARTCTVAVAALLLAATAWAQVEEAPDEMGTLGAPPARATDKARRAAAEAAAKEEVEPAVIQAGPIDPIHYILGPGDVLELDLWGPVTRSTLLPVSPEGTLFLAGNGPMNVSGRTLAWARDKILDMVAHSLRGVHAEVRLVHLRSFKVYLIGDVKQPGAAGATSVTRASEIVAAVGLTEGASRRNIEVRRRDGSLQRLDLETFETLGRQESNPALVDGDVIAVPHATRFISIAGAVARPGRFEFAPGDSVSTLVALGGGLLPSAAPDHSLMIRFSSASQRESLWVDLQALASGGENLPLTDGDQIFVQARADFHVLPGAVILGEVDRPGAYPIVVGRDRVSDLVRWAGGFRPFANRTAIHLVRESPTEGEKDPEFERLVRLSRSEMTESEYTRFQTMLAEHKNTFRVDWSRIQKENVDVDPLLQQGDVVRVEQLIQTVRVEGEVKHPGLVDFVPGRALREYVELSGGFTEHASRGNIRVSRALTGQVVPARSITDLQPGDFVWVPERKDVDAWAVFRDAVAVVGQVAVLIFTLSR